MEQRRRRVHVAMVGTKRLSVPSYPKTTKSDEKLLLQCDMSHET